jgi:hypothetical protein
MLIGSQDSIYANADSVPRRDRDTLTAVFDFTPMTPHESHGLPLDLGK